MPQMNPMNWLILFFYFNILLWLTTSKISFFPKLIEIVNNSDSSVMKSFNVFKFKI